MTMPGRVAFVLGKPPRPDTVVKATIDAMRASGFAVTVHLPHDDGGVTPSELLVADVIVQRGLRSDVLRELLAVESAGVRCCNRIGATIATADRVAVAQRLADAGIGVPRTRAVASWDQVGDAAAADSVVVKSRDGGIGRGAQVLVALRGELPATPPFDGPWVVQRYVPGDGHVRKLYVAGRRQRALRKPASCPDADAPAAPEPFRPSPELADLAAAAGAALGLDIYNVDVIVGPDGPCVVDVNPFPGFRAVPDAAELVTAHVQAIARSERDQ